LHIFITQKNIICQQQFVIIYLIQFTASKKDKLVVCFVSNFSFQSSQAAEVYMQYEYKNCYRILW